MVRKYPNTEYALTAKRKIEIGRDQLAAKEMDIGRANQQKKNFIGAINRFKVVVTQYQTTRHVEEALLRLTECYMALGIVQEAQTAAAVLGHNFPESPWYQDAYTLVKSGGVRAEGKGRLLDHQGVQEIWPAADAARLPRSRNSDRGRRASATRACPGRTCP